MIPKDDTIRRTPGHNPLAGTAAPDRFLSGQGLDRITGGGVDGFRFVQTADGAEAPHRFTLTVFAPAAGARIDLSRIDAIAGTLANDPFIVAALRPVRLARPVALGTSGRRPRDDPPTR